MVGGKAVNDVHVVPERLLVVTGDEAGPDLCPAGADPTSVLVTEEEVVGADLAGHGNTLLLGNPDDGNLPQREREGVRERGKGREGRGGGRERGEREEGREREGRREEWRKGGKEGRVEEGREG